MKEKGKEGRWKKEKKKTLSPLSILNNVRERRLTLALAIAY